MGKIPNHHIAELIFIYIWQLVLVCFSQCRT